MQGHFLFFIQDWKIFINIFFGKTHAFFHIDLFIRFEKYVISYACIVENSFLRHFNGNRIRHIYNSQQPPRKKTIKYNPINVANNIHTMFRMYS